MMSQPIGAPPAHGPPPWHLWGQSKTVELLATGAPALSGIQLARVDYHRPETWHFFFGVDFLSIDAPPLADVEFEVSFDVIPGVGLTQFDTKNGTNLLTPPAQLCFCYFQFHLPAGTQPQGAIITKRWTTRTRSPLLDDSDATSRFDIDHVVAQNLQCQASVLQSTGGPNIGAKFQLTSMFAPAVHLRPDWFQDPHQGPQFLGGELKGR